MRAPCFLLLSSLVATGLAWPGRSAAAESVTIYRCTDASGKVALRDSPCPEGQRQTEREMVRPVDPPETRRLEPVRVDAPERDPGDAPEPPRYIVLQPPRPLYECTTPDGETYTSDSPEGNPRWMPLWALDYPVLVDRPVHAPPRSQLRVRDGNFDLRIDSGGLRHRVVPTIAAYGAGTWVRDACHALPQAEVCDRLVEQRDELRRRAFNAQPSDRVRIEREERGINARLASDCRGY